MIIFSKWISANESINSVLCYFRPHYLVIQEINDTTKLRIVFDASAKTNGLSLNECFYKGQQSKCLLFDTILRFQT